MHPGEGVCTVSHGSIMEVDGGTWKYIELHGSIMEADRSTFKQLSKMVFAKLSLQLQLAE